MGTAKRLHITAPESKEDPGSGGREHRKEDLSYWKVV